MFGYMIVTLTPPGPSHDLSGRPKELDLRTRDLINHGGDTIQILIAPAEGSMGKGLERTDASSNLLNKVPIL